MSLLSNRVAIVTGASKGIGRVMSELFAREGASVVCAARSADLVNETASRISAVGGEAVAVTADAGTEIGARAIIDAGVKAFGRVDTLINNAGDGGPTKAVEDYTIDDWFYTVNSCLTSAYLCSRFAVPPMRAAGRGAIVNIASMAGRRGLPYRVGYCSAKAGQMGLTYGLAVELGRHNITVNAILPARWPATVSIASSKARPRSAVPIPRPCGSLFSSDRRSAACRPRKTSHHWPRSSAATSRAISPASAFRSPQESRRRKRRRPLPSLDGERVDRRSHSAGEWQRRGDEEKLVDAIRGAVIRQLVEKEDLPDG